MNRDEFFALLEKPLKESRIEIDGKQYRLREMSEDDSANYELALQDKTGKYNFSRARRAMIAQMLLDDDGNRIIENEAELKPFGRSLTGALYDECQKLNSYKDGEVKALVKNSDEADG